jgi:hypothetical protein
MLISAITNRLTRLSDELQAAVDQAGDHRRLLEQVKQTAQELLSDQESRPESGRDIADAD